MSIISLRNLRLMVWMLITALVAVTIVSIFWTPFDRSKLFRPLPANAVLFGSFQHPDLRLENIVTNAFLKAVIDSEDTTVAEFSRGKSLVQRVVAARIMFAYAPGSAGASAPVLAFTAWLGGWGSVSRWALWVHCPKEIAPVGEYHGRRLWAFKKPILISGAPNFLSFAFEEGIIIACLSGEQNGVGRLLKNYDGQGDSIVNTPACNAGRLPTSLREVLRAGSAAGRPQWRSMEKSSGADKIWLRFAGPFSGPAQTVLADCSLDMCDTNGFAASIRFEPDIIPARCVAPGHNPPETGKMFVPLPAIIALFPAEAVGDLVNSLALPLWAKKVNAVLAPVAGEKKVCMLTVLTGAYGGRYGSDPFRIAVPAILLAVSDCKAEQTGKDISGLLDLINARYRAGLIINPQVAPAGRQPVSAIESVSAASFLGSMPDEDRPAFCFYQNWLLLSSNGSSLRKIVADIEATAATNETAGGLWLHNAAIGKMGSFIVCEPESGGRVLRLAITGAIFMLERRRSNESTVKVLRAARSWLENMDRMENCRVWFEPEGKGAVARIEIGRKVK